MTKERGEGRASRRWFKPEATNPSRYSPHPEVGRPISALADTVTRPKKTLEELLRWQADCLSVINSDASDRVRARAYVEGINVTHRIAKLAKNTPEHETEAANLRNAAKDAFEFVEKLLPLDAVNMAGFTLTGSCRSEDGAINVAFLDWGIEATAALVEDALQSYDLLLLNKATEMQERISTRKNRLLDQGRALS